MNRYYLVFMAMGFELVGLVLVFLYLGRYLDKTYHFSGLATPACLIIGLISWFIHIIWHLRRLEKAESDRSNEQ